MTLRRLLATAAAFAACLAMAGPAQAATFGPAIPLPAGGFYMGIGDLNFDGNLDMVQTHFTGSASVYTGDGDGTFTVRSPLTVGTQANDALIANFTTDNSKEDIAVVNFGSRDVTMFVNTTATAGAAPTFDTSTTHTIGAAGNARNTTAAADFDNSGALDLAVPTFTNNQASVLLGNGEGLLGAPFQFATDSGSEQTATGQLNGDSKPDLVTANFFTDNISALLNTTAVAGTATFSPKQDTAAGDGARAVAIGNLDGDTNGDVVVANENSQNLSVLIGNGDGTFDPAVNYAIGTGTAGVDIEDLDADGTQDVVVSKSNGAGFFAGNGDGTLEPIDSLPGAGSSDVEIADLNNDSRPDIVTDQQVFLNTTAIVVNSTLDAEDGTCATGACPLRDAILDTNATAGASVIEFDIAGSGPHEIELATPLPSITEALTIDGSTGADAATLAPVKAVFLDGQGTTTNALTASASGVVIRGLAIGNFQSVAIALDAGDAIVEGNFLGTNAAGLVDQGNGAEGIFVTGSGTNSVIGGPTVAQRNVIAGNDGDGILIFGDQNEVMGNFIGVDRNGAPLGNGDSGIELGSSAEGNTVGGTGAGEGNTIASNTTGGVVLTGTSDDSTIQGNRITGNGALGIDLGEDGVTANDSGDGDPGQNGLQNFPVITAATATSGTGTVSGTLNSQPGTYTIELFLNTSCDGSGNGEGATGFGSVNVTTNGAGNATFQVSGAGLEAGNVVTALATDVTTGSTSEFSACKTATAGSSTGGGGGGGVGAVLGVSAQSALPPPMARKTVNVAVVKGTVKVKQPGQRSFRTLSDPAQIRMGSIIDATNGRVRITTAAGGGKTQTAEFYDGLFKVTQTKGKRPVTDLTLAGKLAGCKKSDKATAAAKKKRRGRRLWGNGRGRFRTKGKRSSALVRGTIWLVEDRCNSTTFTRVRRGVVRVRDFRRRRNVTVRAGRTYTAPGRRP